MKTKKIDWKSAVILLMALAVLGTAAMKLWQAFAEYQKGQREYDSLEHSAVSGEMGTEKFKIDFEMLRAVNPDIIGWIYMENLEISYPIVQGKDNEYYLNHTFYRKENKCGCIFLEAENAADFSDDNSFLYGHNMRDKSMFARLNEFQEERVYQENLEFYIYTPEGVLQYDIFSCYRAKLGEDSFFWQYESEEAYGKWQRTVAEKSLYDTGMVPRQNQNTVTLMTCTSGGGDERFLVHGVLAPSDHREKK